MCFLSTVAMWTKNVINSIVRLERVMPFPTIYQIATWVQDILGDEFPIATNGVWWEGDGRPIRKLGLALQGSKQVAEQASACQVDAILLHRPWGVGKLHNGIGILAVHEALDERLTTAENPWLAGALGFALSTKIRTLAHRPLLTLATTDEPMTVDTVMTRLREWFPPLQCWNLTAPDMPVTKIAFATAIRPTLLAIAAESGATLYLTGTLKEAVHPFLEQSHITAIGVGQAAAEHWGMVWLASHLQIEFGIEILWLASDSK